MVKRITHDYILYHWKEENEPHRNILSSLSEVLTYFFFNQDQRSRQKFTKRTLQTYNLMTSLQFSQKHEKLRQKGHMQLENYDQS